MHRTQNKHYRRFPINRENRFLNQFHFQFFQLRCHPVYQPALPAVFEQTERVHYQWTVFHTHRMTDPLPVTGKKSFWCQL